MISCEEAARRLSRRADRVITWHELPGLWIRLAVCRMTRTYARQLRRLSEYARACDRAYETGKGPADPPMPEGTRRRLRAALSEESAKGGAPRT